MKFNQGITLLELLCCLLLVSILFFLSLPSSTELANQNKLTVIEKEIVAAIRYARNIALLNHTRLALTPLNDSDDWSKGMLLFVDNKNHHYQPGDKILHRWQWHMQGVQISWSGFQSNEYLLFASDLKHAATSGHFTLLTQHTEPIKLVVNRLGRVNKVSE